MQKKVTLSIDNTVLQEFKDFCEKHDIMLSKRIERLIKEHLSSLRTEEARKHTLHKRKQSGKGEKR